MKIVRVVGALILAAGMASPAFAADQWTVIHAGTLLAKPGEAPKATQTILVKNGIIESVQDGFADPAALKLDGDVRVIGLEDKFVLPGLIDSHVHLSSELGPSQRLEDVTMEDSLIEMRAIEFAQRTLQAGFTTVRNAGGAHDILQGLRDGFAKGYLLGPRILVARVVAPTGSHGDVDGYRADVMELFTDETICDGADDCRRAVRLAVKNGADLIKVTATGGVLSDKATGTGQQMTDEELRAIVETAHSLGRKVAAHAHGTDGINAALRAGVDSVEHGSYLDAESIRLFKQTGAYLVPTVLAGETVVEIATTQTFFSPAIKEKALKVGLQIKESLKRAHAAGVKIAFGTDSGVSHHGDNAKEFALMADAGLSPMEAIRAATVNAADLLGISSIAGTIEPGKSADLIAVANDPLANIRELENVVFVMVRGVVAKQ